VQQRLIRPIKAAVREQLVNSNPRQAGTGWQFAGNGGRAAIDGRVEKQMNNSPLCRRPARGPKAERHKKTPRLKPEILKDAFRGHEWPLFHLLTLFAAMNGRSSTFRFAHPVLKSWA
jgi:hypothetical protein